MPIIERSADECFATFREHMSPLLAATLSDTAPVAVRGARGDTNATFEFVQGPLGLETKYGTLFFVLTQHLEAVREARKRYRLRTLAYWYRLQENPDGEALIRWEYDRNLELKCRNHVQFRKGAKLAGEGFEWDLNRLHMPTGWVMIEGVVRFLITELDVRPPCGADDWSARLDESERIFHEKLTGKRYHPPR